MMHSFHYQLTAHLFFLSIWVDVLYIWFESLGSKSITDELQDGNESHESHEDGDEGQGNESHQSQSDKGQEGMTLTQRALAMVTMIGAIVCTDSKYHLTTFINVLHCQ